VFATSHGASLGALVSGLLCAGQSGASALGNAALPINLPPIGLSVLAVIPGAQAADAATTNCRNPSFAPGDTLTDNQLLRRSPVTAACDGKCGQECVTGTRPPMLGAFGLRATTITALDGRLSLSLPDGAAVFGVPRLIDGVSVTTGVTGKVLVRDDRAVSGPGWDLIVNLSDFVIDANATVKLVNSQVGIAPTLISSATADVDLATA
jgi:phosphate transport system substrate-binding protein